MSYDPAAMRGLLTSAFDGDELRELCFDYFPEVYAEFTDGQTESRRVQLLLDHVWRQELCEKLARAIERKNANKYAEWADRLVSRTGDPQTGPSRALFLEPVPAGSLFIGREQELAAYRKLLADEWLVIISGLAGVGKTTLGARLAREAAAREDQIFWFTFNRVQKNSSEALLRALAAFLDMHGQPDLARYLDGEISVQKPLDPTAKLNLFIAGLASGDYILCFDDFHVIGDAPDITLLFKQIRDRYPGPRAPLPARFIIMCRDVPQAMQYLAPDALEGLSEADTQAFLLANRVSLSAAQAHRLWRSTAGNAKLLELSVAALARLSGSPSEIARFVETMSARRDLRDFVMHEIYATLSPAERQIAGALSIFPTAVEQTVLEVVLEDQDVEDIVEPLDALADKHLVNESDGRIGCHSLVREFSYRLLSRQDAESFHHRAADYYARESKYVAAAYHHFERGAKEQAADLLTGHRQEIIYGGEAGALLEQLMRFKRRELSPERWVAVCQARGAAHEIRGEYPQALRAYSEGLEDASDDRCRAELLRQIGHLHLLTAQYDQAMTRCQESLTISVALDNRPGIADAHHDMGWASYRLGRLADADAHFKISLAVGGNLGDRLRQAKTTLGLGAVQYSEGNMAEAQVRYEESRRGFCQTGERVREARALNNLGLVSLALGEWEHALAYCQQALAILREIGDIDGLRNAINNIAYTHLRSGNYGQAIEAYEQLAGLTQATGHRRMLSIAYAGLADAQRATGNLAQALASAQAAHREAIESGSRREIGVSLRTLGMAWLGHDDSTQATTYLEQCIPILEELHENDDLAQARESLAATRSRPERTAVAVP